MVGDQQGRSKKVSFASETWALPVPHQDPARPAQLSSESIPRAYVPVREPDADLWFPSSHPPLLPHPDPSSSVLTAHHGQFARSDSPGSQARQGACSPSLPAKDCLLMVTSPDRLARVPRHQPPHVLAHHGAPAVPQPAPRDGPRRTPNQRPVRPPLCTRCRSSPFHPPRPLLLPLLLHPCRLSHCTITEGPTARRTGPDHDTGDRGRPATKDSREHCPPQDGRDADGEAACHGIASEGTEEQDERQDCEEVE